ncbi:MAG: response regulator [Planctomycetota bacterium]
MKECILLAVDDKPDNLYVIKSLVAEHLPHCRVLTASDAEKGLEIARAQNLDGALIDVQMPGISGIQMCRMLKEEEATANVPVILITAHGASGRLKAEGLLAGAHDFLNKPIDNHELIARIRVMLRVKQMEDALRQANADLQMQVEEKTRSLKESEVRFRHIAESMADWIWEVDNEGRYTYVSEKVESCLGYSSRELIGKTPFDLMRPEEANRISRIFSDLAVGNKPIQDLENWNLTKEGREICLLTNGRPLFNEQGDRVGYRGVDRDVTERKRLEAQLRQAQKMEAVGTLAGGIAHDFNNILYALMGYTDLALDLIPRESEAYGYLEEAGKAANRAKELVAQILTFSRQTDVEYKPFFVDEVVKEVMNLLRKTIPTTIEIRLSMAADPLPIWGNPVQIHQVVMNLCTNAFHAMREKGGLLDVRLDRMEVGDECDGTLKNLQRGKYVHLRITDTGHGMDEETMKRIFDPYFTTKPFEEGTGLGLSTSFGIINNHRGAITVSSRKDEGTSFEVYFPILNTEECIDEKMDSEASFGLHGSGECILFVDDDPFIVELNKTRLEVSGYSVVALTDSIEALDLFFADPDRFDAVVTDQTMPNLTGAELARRMLDRRPDLPVIICTGFSETLNRKSAEEMGISKYLMKPVAASELMKTLHSVLENATERKSRQ